MMIRFSGPRVTGQVFCIRTEALQANFNPNLFSHQNSRYLPTFSHYNISGHLYIFGRRILRSSFLFRAILRGEYFTLKNNNTPRFPQGFKHANKNKNGAGQKQLVDHFVNKKETIKLEGCENSNFVSL